MEKIWRRHLKALKLERNKYKHMLQESKVSVLSAKVEECGKDSKKLYRLITELTGGPKENPFPDNIEENSLANQFAEFFLNKIKNIRSQLDSYPKYEPQQRDCATFHHFSPLDEEKVLNLICGMASKTCELDVIPTKILKEVIGAIITPITLIINMSLESGTFPSKWKNAIIRPLLKKKGLDLELCNYRPVSNLSFLSKVLEKAALEQFNLHIESQSLLPDYQSAYRQGFSCETALIKLTNDILWAMEDQKVTTMMAIDLSAAFDTVDHEILLEVLTRQFGISDMALNWFSTYLRPRSFCVNIGSSYSSKTPLDFSVPQGSCAGPVLYSNYASTMRYIVPADMSLHGYADDHAIKSSFSAWNTLAEGIVIKSLENCAKKQSKN